MTADYPYFGQIYFNHGMSSSELLLNMCRGEEHTFIFEQPDCDDNVLINFVTHNGVNYVYRESITNEPPRQPPFDTYSNLTYYTPIKAPQRINPST